MRSKGGKKMFDIGRVCVKIAGRDAGKSCVIIKKLEDPFVMIDGETRRRKCNLKHLEPLEKTLDVNEDASHKEIMTLFKEKLKIEIKETKPKKAKPRPKKQHKKKQKAVKEVKAKTALKKPTTKNAEVKPKAETKKPETKKEIKKETTANQRTNQNLKKKLKQKQKMLMKKVE